MGLIGVVQEPGSLLLRHRKLQEHIEAAWLDDYLDELQVEIAKGLIAKGAAVGYKSADGWMQ